MNQSATRTHPEEQTVRTRRHWPTGTLRYAPERPWVGDRDMAFCPGAVILRTQHVWEAGGWPASPAAEDKALLLKISRHSAGEQIAATLLTYRIWDQQATGSARYSPDMIELGAAFNLRTLAALPNSPAAVSSAHARRGDDIRTA